MVTTEMILRSERFSSRRKRWHGRVDVSEGRVVHQSAFSADGNTLSVQVWLVDGDGCARTRTWDGPTSAGLRAERVVLLAREMLSTSRDGKEIDGGQG